MREVHRQAHEVEDEVRRHPQIASARNGRGSASAGRRGSATTKNSTRVGEQVRARENPCRGPFLSRSPRPGCSRAARPFRRPAGGVEGRAGEHRRATDPVAAGAGAERRDLVAQAAGHGVLHPGGRQRPAAEHVDERVAGVGQVEDQLATDGRQAEAVPYPPTPATTPGRTRAVSRASAGPNRSGSSTATGRAPIVRMSRTMPPTPVAAPWWLDVARVVVRLDLEGDSDAVPDVDDAGVVANPGEQRRTLGRGHLHRSRRWILLDL